MEIKVELTHVEDSPPLDHSEATIIAQEMLGDVFESYGYMTNASPLKASGLTNPDPLELAVEKLNANFEWYEGQEDLVQAEAAIAQALASVAIAQELRKIRRRLSGVDTTGAG